MNTFHRFLLAAAGLVVLAGPLCAGDIGFRNDTDGPVIVQGMSRIQGVLRQGKRLTIQPGKVAWDVIAVPGTKIIVVRDAKHLTRTLYQGTIEAGAGNLFYGIKSDPEAKNPGTRVKLEAETPPKKPAAGNTTSPKRR